MSLLPRRVGALATALGPDFLKSPEDTVLRKLLWYRDGGSVSEKQWRDLVEVLRISGAQMVPEYLDTWALRLGITNLLATARGEAKV